MHFWVLFDPGSKCHRWRHPHVGSCTGFFICQLFYHWNRNSVRKYTFWTFFVFRFWKKRSQRGSEEGWGRSRRVDGREIWATACWFLQDVEKVSGLYWIHSKSPVWCVWGVRKGPICDLTPHCSPHVTTTALLHSIMTSKLKQMK